MLGGDELNRIKSELGGGLQSPDDPVERTPDT